MKFLMKNKQQLTLIQPGKGRFTLAYMSHDYLHGSHAGLPGWIRVKQPIRNLEFRTTSLSNKVLLIKHVYETVSQTSFTQMVAEI